MKRIFLSMVVMGISLLVLFGISWAQCPEDPNDLGECDTLHFVPWPETDTCFGGDCVNYKINNPGENFPCFLYVNLFVTHDSNTFWWEDDETWIQDSLAAFVTPLLFWHQSTGGADSVIFPFESQSWNNPDINPWFPWMDRSMFRHFVDRRTGDTVYYNRMLQMVEAGNAAWNVYTGIDSVASDGDSGHVFLTIAPLSPTCQRWWEGERTLLATLTFIITDTMHICFDSTFWEPANQLTFTRYDAQIYFPRHDLPLCIWVGPPQIEVTSPNGGETWIVGNTYDITWTSENIDSVTIEYSTDGGFNFTMIDTTEAKGSYSWQVPDTPSDQCRVRICDIDEAPCDTSDGDFTITAPASITVTSPNGGENWCAGSAQLITWTGTGVTDVTIEYSVNGGADWDTIVSSTPNDGEYSWDLPPDLSTSTTCRVKISDLDGDPFDTSDADFTITGKSVTVVSPNGGEIWIVDSTYNITWTDSCVENVSIEYSVNDGANWDTIVSSTPSDGSHSWQVPDAPSDSCRVRICDIDGTPCDTSDSLFSIVRPDFTIEAEPETLTVVAGESMDCDVILESLYGFSSPCTLTLEEDSLPASTTYDFDPATVVPTDTSILTFYTDVSTPPGTSIVIVTGSEMTGKKNGIEHSTQVVLIVTPPPDFTIEAEPETLEVYPDSSDSFQVTLTSLFGFASPCTLTVDGLDSVGTGVFHPDTLTPTGTSFLVITDTTTKLGVYPVTITATEIMEGKDGPIEHEKTVYLKVLPPCAFEVVAFPDTQWVSQGDTTTFKVWIIPYTLTTNASYTLSVFNLPPGATGWFKPPSLEPPSDTSILTITTEVTTPESAYVIGIEGAHFECRDTTEVILVVQEPTDVEDESDQPNVPDRFALFQNQPNPFNPETKISYYLPEGCEVKLTIYNILGRRIKTLFEGYQSAGMKTLLWDGRGNQGEQLGSGIYFYRLQAGEFNQTRKMTLIK
jgi:hypothetical protein